jgi:hypothetical protein
MLTGTCIRDVFWSENVSALLFENFHLHFAEVLVKHVRCRQIFSVFVLYIRCLLLHNLLLTLCQKESLVTTDILINLRRSFLFLTLNGSLADIHAFEQFLFGFLGIGERLWCRRQHQGSLWYLLALHKSFKSS